MTIGYSIRYKGQAAKELRRLDGAARNRILDALEALAEDPGAEGNDVKKLVNRPGYRLRVGSYRVIFERHDDELLILVIAVGARGHIYRR